MELNKNRWEIGCGCAVVLLIGLLPGCWWKNDPPKAPQDTEHEFPASKKSSVGFGPPAPPSPDWKKKKISENDDTEDAPSKLDFTGLKGVLAGKWRKVEKKSQYSEPATMSFTEKSVEETQYGFSNVGKHVMKDDIITFTDRSGGSNIYGLEFLSEGEIALRPEKVKNGTNFNDLAGRWQRISLPPGRNPAVLGSGPVADARRQVQKIESTLAKHEGVQKSAIAERDELTEKLRSLGVNSAAELKGNVRAQRVAQNLAKLTAEIDGREQQLADIDTALLKAKSLVRKLESEEATLSEVEKRDLTVQLNEVEERTDKVAPPVTPLDVEAAVEKALKPVPAPKKSK